MRRSDRTLEPMPLANRLVAAAWLGLLCACTGSNAAPTQPPNSTGAISFAPREYTVFDITTALGAPVRNTRLNDSDEVAGVVGAPGDTAAPGFLWRSGARTALDGCRRVVYALNNRGQVVCWLSPGVGVWFRGQITRLPGLDSVDIYSLRAFAINNSGAIAGTVLQSPDCPIGCAFRLEGDRVAPVVEGAYHDVVRINARGDLLIDGPLVSDYQEDDHLYPAGGGPPITYSMGMGRLNDMNDSAWVVGTAQGHPGNPVAMLYRTTQPDRLGMGSAAGINNQGVVVGGLVADQSGLSTGQPVGPFIWANDTLQLLGRAAVDSAWVITAALSINDLGSILALGDDSADARLGHVLLLIHSRVPTAGRDPDTSPAR